MPRDRYEHGRWEGGYVTRAGVHVIFRRVRGRLYEVSTRAKSRRAALRHLERFESDPEGYTAEGEAPKGALLLNPELGAAFLTWSRDVKKNSPKWVKDQQRSLAWWEEKLRGADLRALKTARLVAALDGAPGKKHLIATLKRLFTWLRTERHLISTAEDPTYGALKVPQSPPQQLEQRKAISREEFDRALTALEGWPRDALQVLGATGWHVSELEAFSQGGAVERHPLNGAPVLRCPRTKRGVPLLTQVGQDAADAAARLLEHGEAVSYFALRRELKAVGASFLPGWMRHSVASMAINSGADPAAVAAFLNHLSPSTSRRFYATHAVPKIVPTMGTDTPKR